MRIDPQSAAALRATLLHDIAALRKQGAALERYQTSTLSDDTLNSAAYRLHNLYNGLENAFSQISRTFENHVKDQSSWHRELADKMFLDMPPIRPAVLPETVRGLTHDLLGFRHVFRHSYEFELDAGRVGDLVTEWREQGKTVIEALEGFAQLLAETIGE